MRRIIPYFLAIFLGVISAKLARVALSTFDEPKTAANRGSGGGASTGEAAQQPPSTAPRAQREVPLPLREGEGARVTDPAIAQTLPSAPAIWVRGYVVRGHRLNVVLSDGRVLIENEPQIERLERNRLVMKDGTAYYMQPFKQSGSSSSLADNTNGVIATGG